MMAQEFKNSIMIGEGLTVEFKTSRNKLNRDVYETVCAFLNRHGGTIFLGVTDSGQITGVDSDVVTQLKKDFVTAINNTQKINPVCYLSVDEAQVEGKIVLRIYVPESSQVHRCNNRIFDRNEDGDLDITDHTRLVAEMYHRKQMSYVENRIYPYVALTDLREDLIGQCREFASIRRKDHPWGRMNDFDLIQSAQLYQTNPETGQKGVTLAGILLLGKDTTILSAVPHHRTDLLLRKVNLDRYDDRDFVVTNLIESYDRIVNFAAKHLPDPFYLEGGVNMSLREVIFREVASNILIHRDYINAFPARMIIERGQVRTENSNKPHGFGPINPLSFSPFPKNPVIARFFREIGRADELGSGVRNLMKYGKLFGGSNPELIEGDVFRTVIPYPESSIYVPVSSLSQVCPKSVPSELFQPLLSCARAPVSIEVLMKVAGQSNRTRFRKSILRPLLDAGVLEMTIPDKPQSSKQRYRTSVKGLAGLDNA